MENTHNQSAITDKTLIVEVRDSEFASALAAIGIPFADPEHPFTLLERADGTRTVFWRFGQATADGKVVTTSLLKAQKDPLAWIASHSEHPFCYALCAVINSRKFREAEANGRPLVGLRLKGDKTIFVFRDSRKHRKLLALGAKQI